LAHRGPQRFVLPDTISSQIPRADVFYIPYLRFKGHIYSCLGEQLEYKIVDTTQLGYNNRRLPASLGLRPQAMKIQQVGGLRQERFVRLNQKVVDSDSPLAWGNPGAQGSADGSCAEQAQVYSNASRNSTAGRKN